MHYDLITKLYSKPCNVLWKLKQIQKSVYVKKTVHKKNLNRSVLLGGALMNTLSRFHRMLSDFSIIHNAMVTHIK